MRAAAAGRVGSGALPPEPLNNLLYANGMMVRHVMTHTVDVGDKFAEEARKIHYGETEQKQIRGQVSAQETRELLEEGIPVMPLPIPEALKGPLQ